LISAIKHLRKEREENKSSKKELMKQKQSVQGSEKDQQVIKNLRAQLEEARRIEETLEYQKKCLEANIAAQKEDVERRENILMDHLKERTNDLNQLEEEFGQEERRMEEQIIALKIQLEEAKRTEEVMKSQIMKKEEEVENLEEEVFTLRVKIDKLNKKVEETETSISVVENEEKHSTLQEKKNEENRKSYAEILKGRNHGQPESKKTIENTSSRIPSMFKPQKTSIMIMISQRKNSEGLRHKEDHSLPGMKIYFMVIIFIVLTLDIRLQIAGIIKEMFKQTVPMWLHITLSVTNVITMDT
jgi:chromosome segregation ATPase